MIKEHKRNIWMLAILFILILIAMWFMWMFAKKNNAVNPNVQNNVVTTPAGDTTAQPSNTDVDAEIARLQEEEQRLQEELQKELQKLEEQIQADTAATEAGTQAPTPEQAAQEQQNEEEYPDLPVPEDSFTPEEPDPADQDQS